jgi:hypothetical protein
MVRIRMPAAIALAVATTAVFSGCALAVSSFTDDATLTQTIDAVRIDADAGSVVIRGVAGLGDATVHRNVNYRGQKPGNTHRIDGGTLVLNGCGRNCAVSYTVQVPDGVPVSGQTTNGTLEFSNVGDIDVRTSNGRINLDGVAGDVNARTSNGRIDAKGLSGHRVTAETSNGTIDLALQTAQDVRAVTSNGSITLTVPDGSYNVDAQSSNGSKNIDIPTDPDGEHTLDLSTSNGSITVTGG